MKTRWISGLLLLALMAAIGVPASPLTAETPPNPKIASNLGFLLSLLERPVTLAADSSLAQELERIRSAGTVEVTARFERELTPEERSQIEAMGVSFEQVAGKLAQLGPIYGLRVPPEAVPALTRHALVSWLEAVWQPVALSPLDLSVRNIPGISYVDAPAVWSGPPALNGVPLTGQGVVIADFDTGVDVMHPAFLNGTHGVGYSNWDTDGNGSFTPGVDTLGGAVLRFWDAVGDPMNTAGTLDVTHDWIYGDNNGNSSYDATEPIYMAYDANGSLVLESGEFLILRGNLGAGIPTSKIAATLDGLGTSRLRGVNLEQTPIDASGHGTSVSGILSAGAAYWNTTYAYNMLRYYTGLAPDADLLVADAFGLNLNPTTYIPWASLNGAQIMLYEYGSWIQQYLDGSSNHEQLMDLASQNGILQVTPTGNLHCAGTSGCNPRHLQYALPTGLFNHLFNVPGLSPHPTDVWGTMLWLNPTNNLTVRITTPTGGMGNTVALSCVTPGTGWQYAMTADGHQIGCERAADSNRGTAMYNIWINRPTGVMVGNWIMGVTNPAPAAEITNFYIADSATGWAFGVGWLNAGTGAELHTATWPSTCDSCVGVASYATRANFIGAPGALSWFSGRGTRFLDGALVVDVAAPGHYDIIAPESSAVTGSLGSYNATFGGTSAAGPHVAGVAALLYQSAQGLTTPFFVTEALRRGAVQDGATGGVPNSNWGYGKLSAPNALHNTLHDLGDAPASTNAAGAVMTAYPGIQANFPTVYGVPVPGPLHWASGSLIFGPGDSQLGVLASAESDADTGYDEEPTNNLQPLVNLADLDQPDDGLAFPGPVMPCAPLILNIHGFIPGFPPPPWNRLINVWMDGNTDGDWADVHTCITVGDAPEWAVQNIVAPAPGGFALALPTMIYQNTPGDPFWIRVSIAEQPAPPDPLSGIPDGRGPVLGYAVGETEDYLYPQTNFQASVPATCGGGTVNFTHDPASSWPVNFTWNFGDGTVVANPGANPSHTYAAPGAYTVTLTGDHLGIVFSTFQQVITLAAPPAVNFSSDSPVCLGQTLHFTDTTPGAAAWHWDFGGAGTQGGTAQNPTFHYAAAGTMTVTLTVTDVNGCSASAAAPVTVYGLPAPVFSSDSPVCLGATMHFTDTTPGATAWNWNFGGAGTQGGTAQKPTFRYAAAGTMTVTLAVTDVHGCSASAAAPVTVYGPPAAAFNSDSPVCLGATMQFTDTTPGAAAWHWNFGGTGVQGGTAQNPTFRYAAAGTMTVTLAITDVHGCSASAATPVTVHGLPAPAFSSDSPICLGQTMHFTDTTPSAAAWHWNFGGVGVQGGTAQNPTFQYAAAGTMMVTLAVTNTHGCAASAAAPVTVHGLPVAAFNVSSAEVMLGTPITFTNTSAGAATYFWDFGDGIGASTATHPTYTYPHTGTFTTTLTAQTFYGCADTYSRMLRIVTGMRVYLPLVMKTP